MDVRIMFLIKHREDDLFYSNVLLIVLADTRENAKRKAKAAGYPGNSDNWIVEPQSDVIRFTINVI